MRKCGGIGILVVLLLLACSDGEPTSERVEGDTSVVGSSSTPVPPSAENRDPRLESMAGSEPGVPAELVRAGAGSAVGDDDSRDGAALANVPFEAENSVGKTNRDASEPSRSVDSGARPEVVAVLVEALSEFAPVASSETGDDLESVLESDPEDLMDAIAVLEDSGDPNSIDAIGLILQQSRDPDVRIEALDALAVLGEESDVSPHLRFALDDSSPDVRIEVADIAAELSLIEMLPDLRLQFSREVDRDARDALDEAILDLEFDQDEGRYR